MKQIHKLISQILVLMTFTSATLIATFTGKIPVRGGGIILLLIATLSIFYSH